MIEDLTPEQAAWIAGFIDGDGSISLTLNGAGRRWRKPVVRADSTDREILDHLQGLVGGGIGKKTKYNDRHRQAYSWSLASAGRVTLLLEKILPYLRCENKRVRAKMIVEELPRLTVTGGHYSDDMKRAKLSFEATFAEAGSGRGRRILLDARAAAARKTSSYRRAYNAAYMADWRKRGRDKSRKNFKRT